MVIGKGTSHEKLLIQASHAYKDNQTNVLHWQIIKKKGVKIMKCIMNPRPDIREELIKPYKEMEDVYSLSCVVGDAMEREQVMRHDMKPKSINKKIIGPAITVKLTAGDIVDCLCVFEIARPGDVIVIDAFGETETSIWGGLMSGLARNAGIAGAVIDGSCRDTDEAKMLEFPITAKASGPRAAHTAYSGRKNLLR